MMHNIVRSVKRIKDENRCSKVVPESAWLPLMRSNSAFTRKSSMRSTSTFASLSESNRKSSSDNSFALPAGPNSTLNTSNRSPIRTMIDFCAELATSLRSQQTMLVLQAFALRCRFLGEYYFSLGEVLAGSIVQALAEFRISWISLISLISR